jgi:nitroreductase
MFKKSVQELIKTRTSCRSYIAQPIAIEKQERIKDFLDANLKGPFGSNTRFKLISATHDDSEQIKQLSTYGFIKGATGFIIGAVDQNSEKNMEDYGYMLEKIVLIATDLDLGTCWLGGTFHKSSFAQKISIKENEILPAVAAIGNRMAKPTALDSVVRWVAGSKNRKAWEELFFMNDFDTPIPQKLVTDYETPLEMLRLGPSASNKQPWRIIKEQEKNIFHFFLQRTKNYYRNLKLLKWADLQRIDMGIAICHFELSSNEMGLSGQWKTIDPKLPVLPELTEYIISWVGE